MKLRKEYILFLIGILFLIIGAWLIFTYKLDALWYWFITMMIGLIFISVSSEIYDNRIDREYYEGL